MLSFILVIAFAAILYRVSRWVSPKGTNAVVLLVMAGYSSRLVLSLFLRSIKLFSHEAGGDCAVYDEEAQIIARVWSYEGIHWVGADELPPLGRTSLPPNLFALVKYADGPEARLGCNAIIALVACLACLNIYALAIEMGAAEKATTYVLGTLLLMPSFLYYTSDMYKDGVVEFCVIGIGGAALRLGRRFSVKHLLFAGVCMWVLAFTRFYLVYAAFIPLLFGLVGARSRSTVRMLLSIIIISLGALAVAGLTNVSSVFVDDAAGAYQSVTAPEVHDAFTRGGSGVDVQGTSLAQFPIALLFTLFAPFPWQSGSLGLQLGKIDCLAWYVIMYFAVKGTLKLYRTRISELIILLSFIVPTTVAYAAAFANIGLTVRERLGVVMMSALLGTVGASRQALPDQAARAAVAGRGHPSNLAAS